MRRKTSGNTCARPISPTACSKTTPQSSTLASSHGAAFSTSSVASSPSPAVIGLLPVNHSEVWYNLQQHRPSGICRVVWAGTWRSGLFEDRQAGDRDPLASCRLPSVLALEIKTARWPPKDPAGNPSAHSRDQSRQLIVGRATDAWRASQALHRCRTNHRCKVYGEGKATAVPRVEDVPS